MLAPRLSRKTRQPRGILHEWSQLLRPEDRHRTLARCRLPIVRLVHDSAVSYPVPRNLNYFWTFGGILAFMLVAQIVTGIILAMHYTPNVDAWPSTPSSTSCAT
jgi:quinol-cytochrome oxidoreductase complex cytochrome b subunit